jgi:hypothetical protein
MTDGNGDVDGRKGEICLEIRTPHRGDEWVEIDRAGEVLLAS